MKTFFEQPDPIFRNKWMYTDGTHLISYLEPEVNGKLVPQWHVTSKPEEYVITHFVGSSPSECFEFVKEMEATNDSSSDTSDGGETPVRPVEGN